MNKPLLLTLAAAALVAAGVAAVARQTAPPTTTTTTTPTCTPTSTEQPAADTVPFAHLIGEHCTAWITAPGGGESRSLYSQRVGGIWTVDSRPVAVSGKLTAVEGGWARFLHGRDEETWVPLTAIIALQRDSHIRAETGGGGWRRGPGIHILPHMLPDQTGQERP